MYRFRTIDSLLGTYKELENQEIYFATSDELNDPMEGYRNIFWKGDEIVWRNFIINYVKSLEQIFGLTVVFNDEREFNETDIQVSYNLIGYKTPKDREIKEKILEKVFKYKFINNLHLDLTNRRNSIRRNELLSYLKMIHPFIVNSISEVYYEHKFTEKLLFFSNLDQFKSTIEKSENFVELINKLEVENSQKESEQFFLALKILNQSLNLYTRHKVSNGKFSSNGILIMSEFPEKFISKLESEIYPKWYSASFLFDCKNSSIWGHYGDNHEGVCLKFKTNKIGNNLTLNLKSENGNNSKSSVNPHIFRKIKYDSKHTEIDFFRSIGRLTKNELNLLWYAGSNGKFSICGEHLNKNEKEWIKKYWENFYNSLSIKLKEWSYEQEYRLIINGDFIDYTEKKSRKLKYNFNDLEGIIFGIKTKTTDKIKILKIIEDKCKSNSRKEFDFYEAYYSNETGKIETMKLNLLEFE